MSVIGTLHNLGRVSYEVEMTLTVTFLERLCDGHKHTRLHIDAHVTQSQAAGWITRKAQEMSSLADSEESWRMEDDRHFESALAGVWQ
jgi:hypothetical protein